MLSFNNSTETYFLTDFPQFTFELSNVGVDSGRVGILETRKLKGSYRWKRERMTQARRQCILSMESG